MPTNHAAVAALPTASAANPTLLRNLLVQRMAYVVDNAAGAADLVAVDPTTGATILVIICLGRNFLYDAADTTTVHDGVSCLVTSDGKRYKLEDEGNVLCYSVLSRDSGNSPPDVAPPDSPSVGDAFLIPAAATGDWAGHADDIGVYTARGWEFIEIAIGRLVYVEDEDAYYRKKADGTVAIGFGANALSAGSVLPSHMLSGAGTLRHIVENRTTNAQPAASDGVKYIIGPSPTGAIWSGNAGKLAVGEGGTWVVYTPAEGWRVYDKATDSDYVYSGSAWVSASGNLTPTLRKYTSGATWSKPPRLAYVEIMVMGGGGGAWGSAGNGGNGGTSSFGAHASATGGAGGTNTVPGAAGVGSGGNESLTGHEGSYDADAVMGMITFGGASALPRGTFGQGGRFTNGGAGGATGGGAGAETEVIQAASLGSTETVTVGAAGSAGGGGAGTAGGVGLVLVREYTYV